MRKPREAAMTFQFYTIDDAPDAARGDLEKVKEKFGFVPAIAAIFAGAPAVLEAFVALERVMEKTSFTPTERAVIFLTASEENDSRYCIAAHIKSAESAGVADDVIRALYQGEPLRDPKLEALRQYTLGVMENHGRPSEAAKKRFLGTGYAPRQALEAVLGITAKTLTNYTARLAHTQLDQQAEAASRKTAAGSSPSYHSQTGA
jgi:AhpD family alkylhydroperoxidase